MQSLCRGRDLPRAPLCLCSRSPAHAPPPLPTARAEEWSSSQQRKYWYNKRTKQSLWDSLRKTRPISFRSCSSAMLRWDRRMEALPEDKLLELADEIPPPIGQDD